MPRNGVGVYSLPATSWNPATTGGTIESTAWNTTGADIAAALTQSLSKDGQTVPTGNIQLGNFKIVNLAAGAASSDAMTYGQGAKLSGNNTFTGNNIFTGSTTFNGSMVLSGSLTGLNVSGSASFSETVTITKAGTGLIINSTAAGTMQQMVSTDAGAAVGPSMDLYRNSATPTANDKLGEVKFSGNNASGSVAEYASINGVIQDTTAGSEDGWIEFATSIAGTKAVRWTLWGGWFAPGLTEQGQGTINATGLYVNNVALASAAVDADFTQTGSVATGATVMPYDDTIPQITEGTEFMTRTYTPRSALNRLRIDVVAFVTMSSASVDAAVGALFQDAVANALASGASELSVAGEPVCISFTHWMVAGTTSEITFRFRAGPSAAATLTFNGSAGVRRLGGTMASSITVTEFIP